MIFYVDNLFFYEFLSICLSVLVKSIPIFLLLAYYIFLIQLLLARELDSTEECKDGSDLLWTLFICSLYTHKTHQYYGEFYNTTDTDTNCQHGR